MALEDKLAVEKKKRRNRRIGIALATTAAAWATAVMVQSATPGHALPVTNEPPQEPPPPNPNPDPNPDPNPRPPPQTHWYDFLAQMPKVYVAYTKVSSHALLFAPFPLIVYGASYFLSKSERVKKYSFAISLAVGTALSAASEVVQYATEGRHGSLEDIALNFASTNIGVLAGLALQASPYVLKYANARLKASASA
jgi:VanZ family protein